MSQKTIEKTLICPGTKLSLPLENIKNNETFTVNNIEVSVVVPDGVTLDSVNLPRGTYNSVSGIWSIGSMAPGETLFGELIFEVIDDCLAPFKFTYQVGVTGTDYCETDGTNNGGCVLFTGLTCCEITESCEENMAKDNAYVVPRNFAYPFNVSLNDDACITGATRTYQWIELPAHGTITGLPDNSVYTPNDGYCGVDHAVYGLFCNGSLQDKATVTFHVSCGLAVDDWLETPVDTPLNALASLNDLSCINGGDTRYILSSNESADSGGLAEPTSEADVTVTAWSQVDGAFTVEPTNGFSGVATFEYFIRCIDPVSGNYWDSNPATVHIGIPDLDVPASSSAPVSSSGPVPSSSYPAASSSATASSSPVASSSNEPAASSSATASSSVVASSSEPIISSSVNASSSASPVSSDIPDSSDVASSSNIPESSSVPEASSSNVVSSSLPPAASSSIGASSSPVPSSSVFIPSSNPAASSSSPEPSSSNRQASSSNREPSSSMPPSSYSLAASSIIP